MSSFVLFSILRNLLYLIPGNPATLELAEQILSQLA